MKNILFIIPNMEHGGTGKSLENLLGLLDRKKYNWKVVCSNPASHGYYEDVFKDYLVKWPSWFERFLSSIFLMRVDIFFHRYFNMTFWFPVYKYMVNKIAKRYKTDIVVGYQENRPVHLASSFKSKSIVWIHGVYSSYVKSKKCTESCCFHRIDSIVCVSRYASNVFKMAIPEVSNKVTYIYNLLDINKIVSASNNQADDSRYVTDKFTIVSVGRFNWVKQYEKIPRILVKLKEKGIKDYRWYIIGDGSQSLMTDTMNQIHQYGLEDQLFLLGQKDNPYPYIKNANLLVSTSYTESFSYVIHEAKVLYTPVLSSDCLSAYELISEDWGIIKPIEEMHEALADLITNKDGIYDHLVERCKRTSYSDTEMLSKIEKLFS